MCIFRLFVFHLLYLWIKKLFEVATETSARKWRLNGWIRIAELITERHPRATSALSVIAYMKLSWNCVTYEVGTKAIHTTHSLGLVREETKMNVTALKRRKQPLSLTVLMQIPPCAHGEISSMWHSSISFEQSAPIHPGLQSQRKWPKLLETHRPCEWHGLVTHGSRCSHRRPVRRHDWTYKLGGEWSTHE